MNRSTQVLFFKKETLLDFGYLYSNLQQLMIPSAWLTRSPTPVQTTASSQGPLPELTSSEDQGLTQGSQTLL